MTNKASSMRNKVEEIRANAPNSPSMAALLESIGYSNSPGNYKTLKSLASDNGIVLPNGFGTARAIQKVTKPLKDILVENSSYKSNQSLKKRLLQAGLLDNKCYDCLSPPLWNGKELVLQLDHINGKNNDNRLENLQLLCPNCHSQTETFCKGAGNYRANAVGVVGNTCECGANIGSTSVRCRTCAARILGRQPKITWPNPGVVKNMVSTKGFKGTGELLGVSDNAVRKFLLKNFGTLK